MGTSKQWTTPNISAPGGELHSAFISDEVWSSYPRWKRTQLSVRARRGRNIEMRIPLFHDLRTPWPWTDPFFTNREAAEQSENSILPLNCVIGDHGVFSIGCCALQVTIQGKDLSEARYLHDQLSVLGPVILALSAGAPIMRGFLLDTDTRWQALVAYGDDRTCTEQEAMVSNESQLPVGFLKSSVIREVDKMANSSTITQSNHNEHATTSALRFSTSPVFISDHQNVAHEEYHKDLPKPSPYIQSQLQAAGIDPAFSRHLAWPLSRDPLLVSDGELQSKPDSTTRQFDTLYGTSWPHVRLKVPLPDLAVGWRVEFRAPDVQLTDVENAAFATFVVLVGRAVVHFGLRFYIPVAKVAENMERASRRNAALTERLWFRRHVSSADGHEKESTISKEGDYSLMTLDEIVNGSANGGDLSDSGGFPGLIPLVRSFLAESKVDEKSLRQLNGYLDLVSGKASGRLWTAARWMRWVVQNHEMYQSDSVVSERVCYDLLCRIRDLAAGATVDGEKLHGKVL